KGTDGEAINVLHVALMKSPESMAHEEGAVADVIAQCEAVFQRNQAALKNAGVRMVSLLFQTDGARQPRYLSFRECMDYKEDPVRRDMRP
ncbi:unnamed protein product, partial [Ectocarpus sp. 12 AP-2014]